MPEYNFYKKSRGVYLLSFTFIWLLVFANVGDLWIPVKINTPFYLQSWFLMLAAFLFIVAGPWYFRYRTQALNRQNQLLEARVRERTATIEKQAEELRQKDKYKSRFFNNLSHELRTPLSLILGPVGSLLHQDHLNEHDRKLLKIIEHNGTQLLKVVNEILDLSKLEAGKMEINETIVNWFEIMQPALTRFSSMGDSQSVQLKFDFRADVNLRIYLDPFKFEKIIHNFLSNAIKFTRERGKVELIAEDLGENLLVTVRDNGPGIHPGDLPYVFDRFYQSQRQDVSVEGGTGIGMSLVKELAELLQGRVWVESAVGQGSSFFFCFPKKTAEATGLQAEGINPEKDDPLKDPDETEALTEKASHFERDPAPIHLLIVEDNPELREYLGIILAGYTLTMAENGKVATEILQNALLPAFTPGSALSRPDLILSDLLMPVMNGIRLLDWVKGHDEYRHVPFIMLTARTDMKVRLRALRVGVDDYITKPFAEEELKIRISNLLGLYRERLKESKTRSIPAGEGEPEKKAIIGAADTTWLEEVEALFSKNLADPQCKIDWVAYAIHLSERQFNRRLKQLTGLTPNQYLREMRLQTAKDFLYEGKYTTIKEVSTSVGYMDTAYFSRLFRERFGTLPSEYLR
ncbi:MAG: ATP-binding protein [Bacteroidales bacterium]|nr:ATP-binding protein [Bacteroidales bacterium]